MSKKGITIITLGLLLLAIGCYLTAYVNTWYIFTALPIAAYGILGAIYLDRQKTTHD